MRYSKIFGKTIKTAPAGAEIEGHRLLVRGGFIDQLSAGIYSFLPLGWRVVKKIENIIREEMNNIGGQEVFLPSLQPKSLWLETDRWDHMDPPLFKLEDQHDKEYALGPTHEEVITDLVRSRVDSYKDLPLYLFQIQNKFRNEIRSTGGLLRVREFMMKDLYSFHTEEKDLAEYFHKVIEAYKKVLTRCELESVVCQASGGTIGGQETYEFHVVTPVGEDKIVYCPKCQKGVNMELAGKRTKCSCGGGMESCRAIEVGHVFSLGTKYSKAMKAEFVDKDGKRKPAFMGCYGIGLGRLMATIVEVHHDERGIIWPKSVAPYAAHLIDLNTKKGDEIYKKLIGAGIDVLYDDREDVSAGEKFADADLIGIPVRLVVSEKTLRQAQGKALRQAQGKALRQTQGKTLRLRSGQVGEKVEWKERGVKRTELLEIKDAIGRLI